jgi:hypothetical protein
MMRYLHLENILNKLFGKPEEINGDHRCPTYLFRWIVAKKQRFSVYLHHCVGDDWSLDMHDHPKRFITIGLKGSYTEETPDGRARIYRAPWIRSFPPEHIHRICTPQKSCWTLVIVGKPKRDWGFWHGGTWIQWRQYIRGIGGIADKMKSCP